VYTSARIVGWLINNESDVAVDGFGEEGCRNYNVLPVVLSHPEE
jgi:hypothetical protein